MSEFNFSYEKSLYSGDPHTLAQRFAIVDSFDRTGNPDFKTSFEIIIRSSVKGLMHSFAELFYSSPDCQFLDPRTFVLDGGTLLLICHGIDIKDPYNNEYNRSCKIILYGKHANVQRVDEAIVALRSKISNVYWWYKADGSTTQTRFTLVSKDNFKPELYPWIPNVEEFIHNYNESDENVLLILGDPGTGKTSFIRHMITSLSGDTFTTYDEEVMKSDQIYVQFLSQDDAKFLVLEDADILLQRRVTDGNHVMSKMLNAADGLVSFSEKKLIFTANIVDAKQIDEALIRPGRCFDKMEFRKLTRTEAEIAADAIELPLIGDKKEYSVAEIFNGRKNNSYKMISTGNHGRGVPDADDD